MFEQRKERKGEKKKSKPPRNTPNSIVVCGNFGGKRKHLSGEGRVRKMMLRKKKKKQEQTILAVLWVLCFVLFFFFVVF